MVKTKTKMYTISELASICGVSVASISVFIKNSSFKPVKTGSHNKKYFDDAVKKQLEAHYQSKTKVKTKTTSNSKDDLISSLRERIEEQKHTIALLEEQLKVKDEQIKNASILASQAQQLDLAKIETKNGNKTEKEVVNAEESSESQGKKSFFEKIFGK